MKAKPKQPAAKPEKSIPVWAKIILAILLVAYVSVFLTRHMKFVTDDLGRHITNGKVFVETGKVISTNFYSYTEPDFPAINHHWGSGVIFYYVHELSGFRGLTLFYVIAVLLAALLFVAAALRFADWRLVFFSAVVLTPLIAYRTEVRPEGISYFFVALYFYLLLLFRERKLGFVPMLAILAISQLIWVNCHIFFFMGFVLVTFFLLDEYIYGKDRKVMKQYLVLVGALTGVSLINPFFIQGFLAPLTILNEYGYIISENSDIFIMHKLFNFPEYTHFDVAFIFVLLGFGAVILQKNLKPVFPLFLTVLFFGLLSVRAIRGIPLFAIAAVPAVAFLLNYLLMKWKADTGGVKSALAIIIALLVIFNFANGYMTYKDNYKPGAKFKDHAYFSPIKFTTGMGIYPGLDASAKFFLQNNLKGPVFNNYDIGGYLIYYLHDKGEKVFVDNRPEAYSVSFFEDLYIPMQKDMRRFREEEKKYKFNCVWFHRKDNTSEGKSFMKQLLNQQDYAPVFADYFTIMFLKRNAQNAEVITKYELDKAVLN